MEKISDTPNQMGENMDAAKVTLQHVPENREQAGAFQPNNEILKPNDELNSQAASDTKSVKKQEAAFDLRMKENVCSDVGREKCDAVKCGKPASRIHFPYQKWLKCPKCNVFYSTNYAEWIKHVGECQP